eukprot:scaffold54002_cov69-Phaeocystis_antarctica.AAC.1
MPIAGEHARVARVQLDRAAARVVAEGRLLVPAVAHSLDVRVAVEVREGVGHPQHVDVGEEHGAADRQKVDQHLELEPRGGVVVGGAGARREHLSVVRDVARLAPLGSGLVEGDHHRVGYLGALLEPVDVELQHVEDVLVGDGGEHLATHRHPRHRLTQLLEPMLRTHGGRRPHGVVARRVCGRHYPIERARRRQRRGWLDPVGTERAGRYLGRVGAAVLHHL